MVKHILLVILLILEIFCFDYEIKTQLIDSGKPSRLHSYTEIQGRYHSDKIAVM